MRGKQNAYLPGNLEKAVWSVHKTRQAEFIFIPWHSQVSAFMQLLGKTIVSKS